MSLSAQNLWKLDRPWVSRLLLGALSEHEQRLLVIRLIELDAELRNELLTFLAPFKVFDIDLMARYESALAGGADVEAVRPALLAEGAGRSVDLQDLMRRFTFADLFELGETTRFLFSWSMAEHLLAASRRADIDLPNARTSLYLAEMVLDIVEMLGRARHSPEFPALIADCRARLEERREQLRR